MSTDATTIRLATVPTPRDSGLLASLLPAFEREMGVTVKVYAGEDACDRARLGEADLVIAHYGHKSMEQLVMEGTGRWPCHVFANQLALIGPSEDPTGIRGLADATAALRRIADARAPFIMNAIPGVKYLTQIIAAAAAVNLDGTWVVDTGIKKVRAASVAAEMGGYFLWGVTPFLRFAGEHHERRLAPLVTEDPILQRGMVSVVINPERVPGVDAETASILQAFLLTPDVQAQIRAFRVPEYEGQLWWPRGRENARDHLRS